MSSRLLIKGSIVWSEAGPLHEHDLLIGEGRILHVGRGLADSRARRIDAQGWLVFPGFVDMQARLTHLSAHGRDDLETIQSGLQAAAWGGFTKVLLMPDTEPPFDRESDIEYVHALSARSMGARALVCASLTKERAGRSLTELAGLKAVGALAAGDGRPIKDPRVLRNALQYADMLNMPILTVAQDCELSEGGSAHEGRISLTLGLSGIPAESEWIALARDLLLAESTGGRLHVQGLSTARSVDLVREAKARGVRVTAECTFYNLLLCDDALTDYDTTTKLMPPLRPQEDVMALVDGVQSGVIDVVVSGHTPVSPEDKDVEFELAKFGAAGFEAILPALHTEFISQGTLSWNTVVDAMSRRPREILGLRQPTLSEGEMFEATLFNPTVDEVIEPREWRSLARNTPLAGRRVKGRVEGVFHEGQAFGRWAEEVLG